MDPIAAASSKSNPIGPETAAKAEGARLGLPSAELIAGIGLALLNAYFVARLGGKTPQSARLLHHAFDAGQLIAIGAFGALIVRGFRRVAPKGRVWSLGALGLCSIVLAWIFVRPDLANFSDRIGGRSADLLWVGATLGVATWLPAAVEIGSRLAVPRARWLGVTLAASIAFANERVLRDDYRGAHLFFALSAALLAASSLEGLELPRRLGERAASRFGLVANVFFAVAGAVALVVPPSPVVQLELVRVDGAVVAPVVAAVRKVIAGRRAHVPDDAGAWFHDRRHEPSVPPSAPATAPKDAIVLLVTVDSMRASLFTDASSAEKLPRLEELRNRSVDFTMARAPAARTVTTWGSVFTGKYFSGIAWHGISITKDATVRFPTLLSGAGIPSWNILSDDQLGKRNMKLGFTEEEMVLPRKGQTYATSTEVIPKIIARLEAGVRGPLFVFAHLMDPHFPYDSVTNQGSSFQRYLAEVGEADRRIGELEDAIDRLGLRSRTVLIVAADHGEAFGQHDTLYHTSTLYEELIRVPLFVRGPQGPARHVDQPVSLMDLGPTILDLYGVATPPTFLGQSLVPFLRGESPTLTRPIAAERIETRAFVVGNRKIVVDTEKGLRQIFDLSTDPSETKNLLESLGPQGEAAIDLMEGFFEAHAWRAEAESP